MRNEMQATEECHFSVGCHSNGVQKQANKVWFSNRHVCSGTRKQSKRIRRKVMSVGVWLVEGEGMKGGLGTQGMGLEKIIQRSSRC